MHSVPTTAPRVRTAQSLAESQADLHLIDRLVRGDAEAWRQFVNNYQRLIFARVLNTLRQYNRGEDHTLAEDICADVFALLIADNCDRLRRFEGRSKLSTWLDVVARRICLRRVAQSDRGQQLHSESSFDDVATSSDAAAMLRKEESAHVRAAMAQLAEADQCVLRMFYFEHQSYQQIAAELNLSVNTVGPKLQRAQQRLGKILRAGHANRTAGSDP